VPVKLILTWDIIPGREQEYFEFMVREFIPGMQRLGLEPADAWFTIYGDHPQIIVAAQSGNPSAVKDVLQSKDWQSLITQLQDFVEDYNYKIIPARGGFQL
jgi:hypothetical protein